MPHETPSPCHRIHRRAKLTSGWKRDSRQVRLEHTPKWTPPLKETHWLHRREVGFHCLMTLLFPLLIFHMWDRDCSHLKREKKRAGIHLSLADSLAAFSFPLKSSALSHFWSDFLRQLNYAGPGPFVFEQNIREWSLWVIRNVFQLDPISHLVSWRLLAKTSSLSSMWAQRENRATHVCAEPGVHTERAHTNTRTPRERVCSATFQ